VGQPVNSRNHPHRVAPRELAGIEIDGGRVSLVIAPASWTLLSLCR
jgi:hypothetical protein